MGNQTKYKPILFQTDMVQAILLGRKIQTRRIVKDPLQKPKYKVGDVIWVRETFVEDIEGNYLYKADVGIDGWSIDSKWKPSIFMPKPAARIFLEVTEVRTEPLKDITEEDSKAEGVDFVQQAGFELPSAYKNYMDNSVRNFTVKTAKESFETLWLSINGIGSWNENPSVFAYTFKVVAKPADFC
jgi:hypothetical protein